MTIVLNTLEEGAVSEQIGTLVKDDMEVVNTSGMKIAHCMGCNQCWLKTPGVCAIKDDYAGIIKKLVGAENLPARRQQSAQISFILHGGFDEGHQLRLCERFLQSLPAQLGCTYGGCLIQGGSFLIRMRDDEKMQKAMDKKLDDKPYL